MRSRSAFVVLVLLGAIPLLTAQKGGCKPVPVEPVDQPQCVEYQVASSGQMVAYAANVGSYGEAEDLLAYPGVLSSTITEGTCAGIGWGCTKTWEPVCGSGLSGPETYANLCSFLATIRQDAGTDGQAKGTYTKGECGAPPASCESNLDCAKDETCEWSCSAFCKMAPPDPACCSGTCVPKPDSGCSYGGVWYSVGDSFGADDGCNTCFCGEGGVVGCTKMACPSGCVLADGTYVAYGETFKADDGCNTCTCTEAGVACTKIACPPGCWHNGDLYGIGESFKAGDGCNTCTCTESGVACTEMACQGCEYNGAFYGFGESFPAADGCNTCTCTENGVGCTKIACPPPKGCTVGDAFYEVGESFMAEDGCNKCSCQADGAVICTKMACVAACEYEGQKYMLGDTFPSSDGCNTCTCLEGGVACTLMFCSCDPESEWWRQYMGTPETCPLIKYTCPEGTSGFSNACGCGCEQSPDCPEWFNCMPSPDGQACDADAIKACPYSGIAY